MLQWHDTNINLNTLTEGKITPATVNGKSICLLRKKDEVYAFTALCPHASAPLCDGWTDAAGLVVCPLHKYRFDPATGRNTTGEGYKLFRYSVRLEEQMVWVGFLG